MNDVTAKDVREAIVDCFYEAHRPGDNIDEDEQPAREYCTSVVKKIFKDQGVDFENPTKAGLFKALDGLAEFSKNFRSQEVIEKHKKIITDLLSRMV